LPETLRNAVPLSRIVLETDAPYMAPVPHRGKRNESSFIPYIINTLAEVYSTSPENIAETTTRNARIVFNQ
jgi:TatD DNase family protein